MKLNRKYFLIYKLLNSLFTGLSIGILFTIYGPLEDPSIYSLGGICLAVLMLLLALFYKKLLNIKSFFIISILVEFLMIISLAIFLIYKISFFSGFIIYCLYQLTFVFGGYLVRAETLVANEKEYLGKIDVFKQIGYLIGLTFSYIFYKSLEYILHISDINQQIERSLHYPLIITQLLVITSLLLSFNKKTND